MQSVKVSSVQADAVCPPLTSWKLIVFPTLAATVVSRGESGQGLWPGVQNLLLLTSIVVVVGGLGLIVVDGEEGERGDGGDRHGRHDERQIRQLNEPHHTSGYERLRTADSHDGSFSYTRPPDGGAILGAKGAGR